MLATTQTSASCSLNTSALVPNRASMKPSKAALEVVQLNRVNLRTFIVGQDGLFVSVDFKKLNGETRTLTGRLGVKSYLSGGQNKVESSDRPYLTMFDIQLRQYRTVNLSSVSEIRAEGKVYRVID